MSDDEDSERRRRLRVLTPTAVELAEAFDYANRARSNKDRDDMMIELFGRDGKSGRFGDLERAVNGLVESVKSIEQFRQKAVIWGSVLVTLGGALVVIAEAAIRYFLK